MNTFEAILSRRAIKQYDPNYQMSEEEITKLLSLAMESPTAFNIQNWRFVLVRDSKIRQQIRAAAWDQAQMTDASLLIVLCADLSSWKEPQRYWKNAPQAVQDFIIPAVMSYYQGKPQVIRDEAMRSCGLAGQTIMLAAQAMGLDSCPMDGFDYEAVGKIIDLPEDHLISFMIAVGKKTKEAWPKPGQISYNEAVIIDRFSNK
ncbi:MAG: nitroreductase family protein [Verrucomicrobia bacterium]|jgi:nitroreductase|nr:MAG: nitroreductase family protein [Verrucomicrobiota bacterium]MDH4470098.1 nitroreductase family protein [Verrucomicrobiae bacterium]